MGAVQQAELSEGARGSWTPALVNELADSIRQHFDPHHGGFGGGPKFPHSAAIDLLLALNVAKSLDDLSPLKSVGLHKLKGTRRGQWAMTVNARWRICFEFRRGDAYEVEVVDYHRG